MYECNILWRTKRIAHIKGPYILCNFVQRIIAPLIFLNAPLATIICEVGWTPSEEDLAALENYLWRHEIKQRQNERALTEAKADLRRVLGEASEMWRNRF